MFSDVLRKRFHFVCRISGFPRTIEGAHSDVLLQIPEGIHGIALAKIHTNHTKFLKYIPSRDCVFCPIFEYHLVPFPGKEHPKDSQYRLQVPHIIRNIQKVRDHIRVQFLDIHGRLTALDKPDRYEIDEQYITVYTQHFCTCIITAENINCCSGDAYVLVFGSLSNNPEPVETIATVKVFFLQYAHGKSGLC